MASIATQSSPVYVQQAFCWDETESATNSNERVAVASKPAATASSMVSRPSLRPPVTVPTTRSSTSNRRGRCEHVGGILATVLERYGIGIDQLIAEIDGVQS